MEGRCADCKLIRFVNGESVACLDPEDPLARLWLKMRGDSSDLPETSTVYNCDTGKFKHKTVLIHKKDGELKGFAKS